jgi:hypothetical protein
MYSELYKAFREVVLEVLLSGPTLVLLPQPPVVTVLFHLLSANWNGGEVIREAEKVPADFTFSK